MSTEKIPAHYNLWGQIIKSVLVSKRFIRFDSNFMHTLKLIILHIVLILESLGFIVPL